MSRKSSHDDASQQDRGSLFQIHAKVTKMVTKAVTKAVIKAVTKAVTKTISSLKAHQVS